METIPVGVIGVGHLGSLHAKMFAEISGANFVGVYDVDAIRAAAIAREFHCTAFDDPDALLRRVTAVSVATPTVTHFDLAAKAVRAGVHLFVEKPMTATPEEAEELVALAQAAKIMIQVGHIERFNPALLALEKYRMSPMFIESHRLAQFKPRGTDVAVVLDLMIHDIDIILSLVGSPVRTIAASGVPVVSDDVDIANARIEFENGCVANVTASRISQKKMRKMRMFQRDAYISVDFAEGTAEIYRMVEGDADAGGIAMMLGPASAGSPQRRIVYERPEIPQVNALKYELEKFIEAVRLGIEPPVTGREGLRALRVAHDIMEAIKNQRLNIMMNR